MSSDITPGDRVVFPFPPQGIQDLVYQVLNVWENLLPMDSVCLLIAPGCQYIAALGSELSPLTQKEKTYDGNS